MIQVLVFEISPAAKVAQFFKSTEMEFFTGLDRDEGTATRERCCDCGAQCIFEWSNFLQQKVPKNPCLRLQATSVSAREYGRMHHFLIQ